MFCFSKIIDNNEGLRARTNFSFYIYIDLNFYRNKGVVYKFVNYIEKKEKGLLYDITKEDNVMVFDNFLIMKKN